MNISTQQALLQGQIGINGRINTDSPQMLIAHWKQTSSAMTLLVWEECFMASWVWHTGAYRETDETPITFEAMSVWLHNQGINLRPTDIKLRIHTYDTLAPFSMKAVTFVYASTPSRAFETARCVREMIGADPSRMSNQEVEKHREKVYDVIRLITDNNVPVKDIRATLVSHQFLAKDNTSVEFKRRKATNFDAKLLEAVKSSADGRVAGMFLGRQVRLPASAENRMMVLFTALQEKLGKGRDGLTQKLIELGAKHYLSEEERRQYLGIADAETDTELPVSAEG